MDAGPYVGIASIGQTPVHPQAVVRRYRPIQLRTAGKFEKDDM